MSAHGSDNDDDRGHQPQRQPLSRALARLMPPAAITLLNLVGGGMGLLTPSFAPPSAAAAAAAAATATAQSPFIQISSWTKGKKEGEPVPFSPRDGKGKRVQEMNRRFARQVRDGGLMGHAWGGEWMGVWMGGWMGRWMGQSMVGLLIDLGALIDHRQAPMQMNGR